MIAREAVLSPTCCPLCGAPSAPKLLVSHIQAVVAAYYGIRAHYMKSAQRSFEVSHPRQVAMFLSAELTQKSLPAIGRCFDRDHTTVIHAIKAVRKRMAADPELAMDVGYLQARLAPEETVENSTFSKNLGSENAIEQSVKAQAERIAA